MTRTFLGQDPQIYGVLFPSPLVHPYQAPARAIKVYTHAAYEVALDAEEARLRRDSARRWELSDLGVDLLGGTWPRMVETVRLGRGQA